MSSNCNYIYVQGLRFDPKDVKIIWKVDGGSNHGLERLVNIRKNGTGKPVIGKDGEPITVTPKWLQKRLKKGETIEVVVSTANEKVHLRLDPREAEGRKGRKAFDPKSLAGLPPSALRALALEQLRTAPYGDNNRREAVARMLWSVEHLDDKEIASMLQLLPPEVEIRMSSVERSSTPLELSALLLSDERIVSALIAGGKHSSLAQIASLSTLSTATLVYAGRPALEIFEERANVLLLESTDPVVRLHAVRHVRNQDVLVTHLLLPDFYNIPGADTISPEGLNRAIRDFYNIPSTDPDLLAMRQAIKETTDRRRPTVDVHYYIADADVRVALLEQLVLCVEPVGSTDHVLGNSARRFIRGLSRKDPDPRMRMIALEFVDADEEISWLERDTDMFDAAVLDKDEQVRLHALELIEDDELLLNVAEDKSVDPDTAAAAAALFVARLGAGTRTYRRRGTILDPMYSAEDDPEYAISQELSPQEYFTERESERIRRGVRYSYNLVRVAKSASPEALERLVDAIAWESAASDSRYLDQAIEVLNTIMDNPASAKDLYQKTLDIRKSLELAKPERVKEEEISAENARRAKSREEASRRYNENMDDIVVGCRHVESGQITRAAQFLPRQLVEAALAFSTDPEEIRTLAAFAIDDLPGEEAVARARRGYDEYQAFEAVRLMDLANITILMTHALSNPATPSDVLDNFLFRQGGDRLLERMLVNRPDEGRLLCTYLLEHPNATPEQKKLATKSSPRDAAPIPGMDPVISGSVHATLQDINSTKWRGKTGYTNMSTLLRMAREGYQPTFVDGSAEIVVDSIPSPYVSDIEYQHRIVTTVSLAEWDAISTGAQKSSSA